MTDKEMPELKPCPFCGLHLEPKNKFGTKYTHHDNGCFLSLSEITPITEAESWNTRTDLVDELKVELAASDATRDKMRKNIQELKAENEKLKRLAYHKEGVSYQSLFTASIGMADEAEELKAENEQQAAEIERLRKWKRCAAGMRIHLAHDRHQVAKEVYDAVKHDEVKEE